VIAVAGALAACSGSDAIDAPSTVPSTTASTLRAITTTTTPPDICSTTPVRATPDLKRPRYRLTVDVRPSERTVQGDLVVVFVPDVDTDRLVFRLWPNGPRLARVGVSLETGDVTVGGAPASATRESPTVLIVQNGSTFVAGHAVEARMTWRLVLPGLTDDRIARAGDAVRLGSFFPMLVWEPGVGWATDPPTEVSAEASTAPVADFDVTVSVPEGSSVLASGAQDSPGHWTATAMRDFALSVGRFTTATTTAHVPHPVSVTVGVDAGVRDTPQRYLDKAVRVLEDFSLRFGSYPWPTYTIALTPGLRGGVEYPGHTMQGPDTIGRTTSHEIGHQWFYALVGNDQGRDPWLDEGLATYAEGRFEDTLGAAQIVEIPPEAKGHAGEPMTFWESRSRADYPGVYLQSAQALISLGGVERVDCALRLYAAEAAYRIARPADLFSVLTKVFPHAAEAMAGYGLHP
jgi:hypothetical protein